MPGDRRLIPIRAEGPVTRRADHFWTHKPDGRQRGYLRDCGNSTGRAAKAWIFEDSTRRIGYPGPLWGARCGPPPPPQYRRAPFLSKKSPCSFDNNPYSRVTRGRAMGGIPEERLRGRQMTSYRGGRRAAPPATPIAAHTASDLKCRPKMYPSFRNLASLCRDTVAGGDIFK